MTDPLATGPTSNWPRGAPDPVSIPGAIAGDPVRATTWNNYIGQPSRRGWTSTSELPSPRTGLSSTCS